MGLAVVHAIVSAADGMINVDSNPGAGALFEIFLPCVGQKPGWQAKAPAHIAKE